MISMPPVIHMKTGTEDPPFQGRMKDPYFPFEHPAEIMMLCFEQHIPYADAKNTTEKAWKEYHERGLTEEEAEVVDGFEAKWSQQMFPFEKPMDLLEFHIEDLDYTGWADIKNNNITDEHMVSRVDELWTTYKGKPLTDEEKEPLFVRLEAHDRVDYPEDFQFPRPVDLLRSFLDNGKMEMEVDKKFYDPKFTTIGKKESRITATFSIEERDKLELTYNMWVERRRREWTDEEKSECMSLMVERGIMEPPPVYEAMMDELPPEDESSGDGEEFPEEKLERSDYTIENRSSEDIKQLAKDVFDGTCNLWFDKPEDGMVIMMLSMINILNPEDAGAAIGTNKMPGGRVTSHDGGPYRAACFGFSILHKEDVRQFVTEFNKISEFMSGFESPPKDIPEDERSWEEVNISIRNVEEDDEGD